MAGCTLGGALSVTTFLRDAVTVVHAPQGCAHQTVSMLHALMADAGIERPCDILVSGLTDRDVIFGGEECLFRALTAADAKHPNLIVVVTSCVPETIGDDCRAVCSGHPAAERIIYIPTSGFLGGSAKDGENAALKGLAALAKEAPPIPGRVAVIGEKNLESEVEENFAEVKRLLDRLGLSVAVRFCRNIAAADIPKLAEAVCFIVRDDEARDAGEAIARRFGRPLVPEFPRGLSGSIAFLRDAGRAAGCSAEVIEAAVSAEEAYQAEMLKPFAELSGTKISLGIEPFAGTFAVAREAMARLNITEAADGMPVKLPFFLPVGVSGTLKMLYLWRREKRR
ncbi:MAG: nitrogenase component 1 [Methanocorpusculum sp.]|nr:nitrogenase component 1 [Methanocorpusculum sp.]